MNAVWFNAIIGILLTLLIFGGEYAIAAIFSVGALAAFVAFTIPLAIRVFFVGDRFRPGPWNLGRFSIPIDAAACAFVVVMVPIICFPSSRDENLDLTTMNWTCLVYGGPMLGSLLWWVVSARKWFKGPKVNIEHMMLGREGNVVDAKEINEADAASSGSDKGPVERDISDKKVDEIA